MSKDGQARPGNRGFSFASAARKACIVWMAFVLVYTAWPMKISDAARITRFGIFNEEKQYLIAGVEYSIYYDSDKASTTKSTAYLEYSIDNGATWRHLPSTAGWTSCFQGCFRLPIDPQITSATIRIGANFNPLIGSRSHSEKTAGPYQVLQPADPTDFKAVPGNDGSITLTWNDNSNMESSYRITRSGPDGTKTFHVNDTTAHIGPLSYIDSETNLTKDTIYVYSLSAVIDRYELPEDLHPGNANVIAKSKAPIRINDKLEIISNITDIVVPDQKPIDPASSIVEKFPLDIVDFDQIDFNRLQLNKHSLELKPGQSETLTATFHPANTADQKIKWISNNSEVAEVDGNGKVTGKQPGVAKITVETENGSLRDFCTVTVIPPQVESPDPGAVAAFKDIADHKDRAEISAAAAQGFVTGYPDGTFRPDANVTRAEFATMLMKALKPTVTVTGKELSFADADQIGIWAISYVAEAVELGIINGYDDFTFRPNANITHAEMIAMVVRASGLPTDDGRQTGFADDAQIPDWAKPSVSKAAETGIIIVGGLPDTKFAPQAMSTRAEAASAIVRMLEIRSKNK